MQAKKKKTRAATLARGEIKDTDLTVSSMSGRIVVSNKKVTGDETDHPKSVKDDSFQPSEAKIEDRNSTSPKKDDDYDI